MAKTDSKKAEFDKAAEKKIAVEKEAKNSVKNKVIVAYNYLIEKYDFRYNLISMETEFKRKEDKEFQFLDDRAFHDLDQDVSLNATEIAERYFKNWVKGTKLCKQFDPFKDYIFSIPKWDGKTNYIDKFLSQVYLADEEHRAFFLDVFTRWFVAYVGSLVNDATVNHTCFVLVGKQGTFKTTFLNSIVPIHLRLEYLYSSDFKADNKDHEKFLATKMMINFDELQSFNRNDIEAIKSRITQDRVILRLPYAKADTKAWRKASFCGSVNKDEFLNDATGSRRFLPFKIDRIVMDKDFNIDMLYAQALALFKAGTKFWFDSEDIKKLEAHNDVHKDKTMEEEYVLKHFAVPTKEDIETGRADYLSPTDIMDYICKAHDKINANNTVKRNIGVSLQGNGFAKVSKRINGVPKRLWCVKEIHSLEVTEIDGMPLPGAINDLPI